MTIHLPETLGRSLLAEVHRGHFASVDDAMAEAVRLLLDRKHRDESGPKQGVELGRPAQTRKPVWEEVLELTADVPDDEWDKLPTDLAEQHDHYLYGTPKRPVT